MCLCGLGLIWVVFGFRGDLILLWLLIVGCLVVDLMVCYRWLVSLDLLVDLVRLVLDLVFGRLCFGWVCMVITV